MPSISFTQLEVQKRTGNSYQLIMNFDITPAPGPKNPSVNLQYAVYDEHNQIIDTMVLGKRAYTIGSNVYPHFTTTSKNVRVEAWLTGNTLVRTYDIFTTTGAKEFNKISNIASNTLSLTIGTGFKRHQAYQAPVRDEPLVVTGTKPFEKPARVSVFQPKFITLSQNTQNIINNIESGSITVPSWFMNNITWVKSGQITETEFANAYNFLSPQEPAITIGPLPQITIPSIPEVSAVMELTTTNFQVKLNNKIQFSSSLSNADYKRLQDEMSLEPKITLVFLNQTDFNPLSNFSKILRQIQNLLREQLVETVTITPEGQVITAPEPTIAPGKGLMGAGVLGLIGILMLGGFIADHVRKRK